MKKSKVIIMCAAYNSEDYVRQTIESVLSQTYKDFIFVIHENGSTDSTRKMIKQYIDDPRIVYLETDYNTIIEPEKSTLKDWRDIVKPNKTDLITKIDSDDYFEPDGIERMVVAANQNDSDIVFAGCNMFDEKDRNNIFVRKPKRDVFYYRIEDSANDWISMYGSIRVVWGNLYRYGLWEYAHNLCNEHNITNGSDTICNLYMMMNAKNLSTVSASVVNYRNHPGSIYHKRLNPERYIAYDLIRNESVKLLQKWNCTDARTYLFVEQCRESAMYDLVSNLTDSHENYENNCKLLYNILTDAGFAAGLEKYRLKDAFFKKTVETIKKNDGLISEYRYENFCMMLIYGIIKHNPQFFLAGLFHEDNACQWGTSYIKDELLKSDPWIAKIFPEVSWAMVFKYNPSVLVKMLNQDYASVAGVITAADRVELQNYMDKERDKREHAVQTQKSIISEALETGKNVDKQIEKALRVRLLDKEVLNYTLLYDINKGHAQRLLDISIMIRYVYRDDPDMLYMAALALEYLNMPENAVECLETAAKATGDLTRQEEYQAEIARLKEMPQSEESGAEHSVP